MNTLNTHAAIFEALRSGLVPARDLHLFAVGADEVSTELDRSLTLVENGTGGMRFLRGDYGAGKTFHARLLAERAMADGWATSVAVVSENDLRMWRFDELYHRIVDDLATHSAPRGALGDIVDRFFAAAEERNTSHGQPTDAAAVVRELKARVGAEFPHEMGRVLNAIWAAEQRGDFVESSAWLSWLGGSRNTSVAARASAAVSGVIKSGDAFAYLRGLVGMVRAAGYKGLLVVVDEAETLLRQRGDLRAKALNALRQIADLAPTIGGLMWVVTGTPEFFDSPRGVAGLDPLHARIGLIRAADGSASIRQPQITLQPLDATQRHEVVRHLAALYPARDPAAFAATFSEPALAALVERVDKTATSGNARAFLRAVVEAFDRADGA